MAAHRGKRLSLRRFLAVIILFALIWLVIWIAGYSGLLDPVTQTVKPIYQQLVALINDPLGIDWGDKLVTGVAVILPPVLLLAFLFDDNAR